MAKNQTTKATETAIAKTTETAIAKTTETAIAPTVDQLQTAFTQVDRMQASEMVELGGSQFLEIQNGETLPFIVTGFGEVEDYNDNSKMVECVEMLDRNGNKIVTVLETIVSRIKDAVDSKGMTFPIAVKLYYDGDRVSKATNRAYKNIRVYAAPVL